MTDCQIFAAGVLTCQAAATPSNPSQRVVITGQGIASCFGNDVDTFYEKCARQMPIIQYCQTCTGCVPSHGLTMFVIHRGAGC